MGICLCRKEPATPIIPLLRHKNLVRERIVIAGCYRGDMIFVVVYYVDDFEDRELEGGLHVFASLRAFYNSRPRISENFRRKEKYKRGEIIRDSVLGYNNVISSSHCSQHTSS